ncbi:hypothetical protein H4V97_000279 [Flavobacterium sp. CG_23.5]|uniref:hypothetical protein n=1 Tax=Flavobacterium sp. CG_23.5 TaxID=2760708 RepID=UPI001AEAD6FE|nr:hypothetical protein [Flavobacterium sp. CG_23.5]MBP2281961.1 hypothetical protein [Flavobacterium sp. CG_23.5]
MVLTHNQAEVTPKGFLEKRDFNSFMVLDTNSILYPDAKQVFGYTVEILNVIRINTLVNKMCNGFQSNFNIDSSIYYKAISNVLESKPFLYPELESYFLASQKKEEFLSFSRSLADIEDDFYLPYEVDYILLGMNMDQYDKLNEDKKGDLSDSYSDLKCNMSFKKIEIKDFIIKAKQLIDEVQ